MVSPLEKLRSISMEPPEEAELMTSFSLEPSRISAVVTESWTLL